MKLIKQSTLSVFLRHDCFHTDLEFTDTALANGSDWEDPRFASRLLFCLSLSLYYDCGLHQVPLCVCRCECEIVTLQVINISTLLIVQSECTLHMCTMKLRELKFKHFCYLQTRQFISFCNALI